MHRILLSLAVLTSLSACAPPDAASSVQTGLAAERPIASLDQAEIERACDGWASYAEERLASHDGPVGVSCAISAALDSTDPASCETAYTACVARATSLEETCTTGAHPVPECPSDVTVALYEDCMTRSVDQMRALDIGCALAGDEAEIHARLADWTLPIGCEELNMRACAPFAPPAP